MKGHIRERSPGRFAIVIDVNDPQTGQRKRKWHSFAGTKREAQVECARLITKMDSGAYVEHVRQSLNQFLDTWERDWMATNVSPKTGERYSQLLRTCVRPHLGNKRLQSIRAEDLNRLYTQLHERLAARTVRHTHRLLHRIFSHATKWGNIKRNVVALVDAPKVPPSEAAVLQTAEIPQMFAALRGRIFFPLAVVALGTGMRRGELLALRWSDVDLDAGRIQVERSLEQTDKHGLRIKAPKSARSRRSISLLPAVVSELRTHWKAQQEQRLALGLGKSPADALVFAKYDGASLVPNQFTHAFVKALKAAGLSHVTLHTLRHTHASQLIASGMDILTVSRRLGHSSAAITLTVYGHLLSPEDRAADIMQNVFTSAGVGE
jgi:integrase